MTIEPAAPQSTAAHRHIHYTPALYLSLGLNIRPSQPHQPKRFKLSFGRSVTATPADFDSGSVPICFTGEQPNGRYLVQIDDDGAGVVETYAQQYLPDAPVAKSTSRKANHRWLFVYSRTPVPSQTIIRADGTRIEIKGEGSHGNLPTSTAQMVQGDMRHIPELSETALHTSLTSFGYIWPKPEPAPIQRTQRPSKYTRTTATIADPIGHYCQTHDLHASLRQGGFKLRGANSASCPCNKHKHGDRNPSIEIRSSTTHGAVMRCHNPACDYYNNGQWINIFDFDRQRLGLSCADMLKREFPNNIQANAHRNPTPRRAPASTASTDTREQRQAQRRTADTQRHAERRHDARHARLDAIRSQITGLKLPTRARELANLLLKLSTEDDRLQVTKYDRTLVRMLGWGDGTPTSRAHFKGDKRLERAWEDLKTARLGTRYGGTRIGDEYTAATWTWANADSPKSDTSPARNVPIPIANGEWDIPQQEAENVQVSLLLKESLSTPDHVEIHPYLESEKEKEEAATPAPDGGPCAAYVPDLDVFSNPVLQLPEALPHEKPDWCRSPGDVAPMVFLEPKPGETNEQVGMEFGSEQQTVDAVADSVAASFFFSRAEGAHAVLASTLPLLVGQQGITYGLRKRKRKAVRTTKQWKISDLPVAAEPPAAESPSSKGPPSLGTSQTPRSGMSLCVQAGSLVQPQGPAPRRPPDSRGFDSAP